MKTWEMIKELTEDPEKVFISNKNRRIEVLPDGYLYFPEEDDNYIDLFGEWEEGKKPVDFMKLLSIVKSNGDFSNVDFHYEDEVFKECNLYYILRELAEKCTDDRELAHYVLNGKWYIE